jgi:hypothetical protein
MIVKQTKTYNKHDYVRVHGWFDKIKPDFHLSMKMIRQLLPKSYVSIVVNDKS